MFPPLIRFVLEKVDNYLQEVAGDPTAVFLAFYPFLSRCHSSHCVDLTTRLKPSSQWKF